MTSTPCIAVDEAPIDIETSSAGRRPTNTASTSTAISGSSRSSDGETSVALDEGQVDHEPPLPTPSLLVAQLV
jgi:hypothetical protein